MHFTSAVALNSYANAGIFAIGPSICHTLSQINSLHQSKISDYKSYNETEREVCFAE